MKSPSDPRFAFLYDTDLYDLTLRVALKIVAEKPFAEDVRQGAYEIALLLTRKGRGPKPGIERGWMCRVTKFHTYAELRRRNSEQEPQLADDDTPDIPVEDQQTLYEHQMELERRLDAAEQVASEHPEQVAQVLVGDGRTKAGAGKGPPLDAAARKRKERARTAMASAISAALAVAILLLWFRSRPPPAPTLLPGAYATLADASLELARQSCAAKDWAACIEGLDQTRRLDPSKLGQAEQDARQVAVGELRWQAMSECKMGFAVSCVEKLDAAARYDPEGDKDPTVQLARTEAETSLHFAPPPRGLDPDAKPVPRRRP